LNFFKGLLLTTVLVLIHFYAYQSEYVKRIDYKFYDLSTTLFNQMKEESEAYSVIVDIDDKSLQEYGQWPWPRVLDAQLINTINYYAPVAIGVSILYSESDRTSPSSIKKFYEEYLDLELTFGEFPEQLQDNDKLLNYEILNANVTLPIYLKNGFGSAKHCTQMQYRHNVFRNIEPLLKGNGLMCNDKVIQEGINNFGFINASEDSDGILRRVPLFMEYNEQVFPSFALATILSFYEGMHAYEDEETVLVNFTRETPKVISVADVFNGNFSQDDFIGKVVVLGSSAVGLTPKYQTPFGEAVSSSMVNALLIDNMLSNTLITQPDYYKQVNLLLSFVVVLLLYFLLAKKHYFYIVMLVLVLGFISFTVLFFEYLHGTYISLGYLWVPLLTLLIFFVLYHLRVLNSEQQEQEKLFIRQSKLASMGEMISLIAHQWRQPLSSINGTVLNLDLDYRKEKLDPERFEHHLNEIEQRTAYLSSTITDFREFFSHNKESEEFGLSKVIEQAIHLSSLSGSDKVDIIYRKQEPLIIDGFSSELVQSLLVLLNNAIYVCKSKIESIEYGEIYIDVLSEAKKVFISVSDNGGGIPKKNLKQIFDPYFTTKDKHNGTGLGLYILKLIVEDSMNGKVSVKNGEKGAIFTIEIPKRVK
jgi:signal transduction histidine kinase